MTLSDTKPQSTRCVHLQTRFFSQSYAAVDRFSTDRGRRAVPLRPLSLLPVTRWVFSRPQISRDWRRHFGCAVSAVDKRWRSSVEHRLICIDTCQRALSYIFHLPYFHINRIALPCPICISEAAVSDGVPLTSYPINDVTVICETGLLASKTRTHQEMR